MIYSGEQGCTPSPVRKSALSIIGFLLKIAKIVNGVSLFLGSWKCPHNSPYVFWTFWEEIKRFVLWFWKFEIYSRCLVFLKISKIEKIREMHGFASFSLILAIFLFLEIFKNTKKHEKIRNFKNHITNILISSPSAHKTYGELWEHFQLPRNKETPFMIFVIFNRNPL